MEKINAYNEIIESYDDIPMIEHLHCDPYESTKEFIEKEMARLEKLNSKFIEEEDDFFYTLINDYRYYGYIDNTKKAIKRY